MPLFLSQHGICCQCLKNLPALNKVCPQCALPHSWSTHICYRCREQKPCWDELIAVANYIDPLKKLIHHLKFYQKIELTNALARLMFLAWYKRRERYGILKPDLITCVPLHHIRYWSRGFNQAQQLAKPIARWLARDFNPYLLQRKQVAMDQKSLSLNERTKNVASLFICEENLSGKSILLVDDIVTTGNTINVISQQLKKCGAVNIQVICLCRTML
jgi:Predicted amidophosphoribosyltransferases